MHASALRSCVVPLLVAAIRLRSVAAGDDVVPGYRATPMNGTALVPYPQNVEFESASSPLDQADFRILLADVSPKPCDILEQAADRYKQLIFVGSNSFDRLRRRRSALMRRLRRSDDEVSEEEQDPGSDVQGEGENQSPEQSQQQESQIDTDNNNGEEPQQTYEATDVENLDNGQGNDRESVFTKSEGAPSVVANPYLGSQNRDNAPSTVEESNDNNDQYQNRYPWTRNKPESASSAEKLRAVELKVTSGVCEKLPFMEMDESYSITFEGSTATVSSKTVWGALRGLETFSQLVYNSADGNFWVRRAKIDDFPRFAFRGVLLDTSRHFLPKKYIYKNLDLLAQNKYNVFHWHIVDDQSFPYQSEVFPDISRKGAYTSKHVYTRQDVADIIEYARLRGIRVVPEFDTPGHSLSWGVGGPDGLLCKNSDGTYGPMDISNAAVYDFMEAFMREVTEVFPDNAVHLGGDEVDFDCWMHNSGIKKWMSENSFTTGQQAESYYVQKLLDIVERVRPGTSPVVWQEVFDNKDKLTKATVVNVWKNEPMKEMAVVTKAGYKAILSSPWYLNYVNYGADWEPFYKADPQDFTGTPEQKALVMGGSACMWGEFIDATNIIPVLWPRASVVAERLWSEASLRDAKAFMPRYDSHRCRLLKRGYPVAPPNVARNGYCNDEWDAQKRR